MDFNINDNSKIWDMGLNVTITTKDRPFSKNEYSQLQQLLLSAAKGETPEKVTCLPPKLPSAGSVIAYEKSNSDDRSYLCDQYHRFMSTGSHVLAKYGIKKDYWQLAVPSENSTKSQVGIEGSRVKVNFHKHVYAFSEQDPSVKDIVLIHYFGDHNLFKPNPHGNAKTNRPFIRTAKETLATLTSQVKDTASNPHNVYTREVKKVQTNPERRLREEIFTPRDEKQIRNLKQSQKDRTSITNCEIFSIYEMAKQDMGEFILKLDLVPFQVIIFAEPTTLKLCNDLFIEAGKDLDLEQLICYDTTFELADAYVSVLVARNTYVHGDPIFPVAYMIHDRKVQAVHDLMWKTLVDKLNFKCLAKSVPICIDREVALGNSVKKFVPSPNIVYCSNHIRRDVKEWIKRRSAKGDDYKVICAQIPALIQTESEEEFESLYARFEDKWSRDFSIYMDSCVKNDLKTCCAFSARRFPAFKKVLPTNNLSESLNFVIKHFLEWKEMPLDTLVLKLIELQCNHLVEIHRATKFTGNYRLKTCYNNLHLELPSYAWNNYQDLSRTFKEEALKHKVQDELTSSVTSNEVLAARCINMDYVSFVAKQRIWIVRSLFDNKFHTLERDKKQQNFVLNCSCKKPFTCYHKLAVMMSIDEPYDPRCSKLQLSVLGKRSRNHSKKSGRKFPNADDLADLIKAAADSKYAQKKQNHGYFSEDSMTEDVISANWTQQSMTVMPNNEKVDSIGSKSTTEFNETSKVSKESPVSNFLDLDHSLVELSCSPLIKAELALIGNFASVVADNKWLDGETIDFAINYLLLYYECTNVLYVPEVCFTSVQNQSYDIYLHYAHSNEALNYDVLILPVIYKSHWMLGVITFASKTVYLIDSFHASRTMESQGEVFKNLLVIVLLTYCVAEVDEKVQSWKCVYSCDCPTQNDGSECGVIVCLNAFALIHLSCFPSSQSISNKYRHRNRRWLLQVIRDAMLTERKPEKSKHLSRVFKNKAKKIAIDLAKEKTCLKIAYECCFAEIKSAAYPRSPSGTICDDISCGKDSVHNQDLYMCVVCRKWFHRYCSRIVESAYCTYYRCTLCLNSC